MQFFFFLDSGLQSCTCVEFFGLDGRRGAVGLLTEWSRRIVDLWIHGWQMYIVGMAKGIVVDSSVCEHTVFVVKFMNLLVQP